MAALRNRKMGYVLNLVYDKWNETEDIPIPNGLQWNELGYTNKNEVYYSLSSFQMKTFENMEVIDRRIEDVKMFPNENFFYHVWCITPFDDFFCNGKLPISDHVIDLIRKNKNLYLIFMNECEYETEMSMKHLDNIINDLNINPDQVWMINNNSKLQEFKEELNCNINVHTNKKMCTANSWHTLDLNLDKKDLFVCHNRMPKIHRYALLILLKKHNILKDINWSIVHGWGHSEDYSSIFTQDDINYLSTEINYFNSIEIYKSKYEKEYDNFENKNNQTVFFESKTHENAYFNIVTETNFLSNDIHITEKSFKPFTYYQFPLILASYQHLKYFRNGYELDLFDDVINHDYDSIKNNRDRIFKFVDEIKRINNNKDFFIDFYKNNKDRFIKNREKILSFNHDYDYNFFKKLNRYGQ